MLHFFLFSPFLFAIEWRFDCFNNAENTQHKTQLKTCNKKCSELVYKNCITNLLSLILLPSFACSFNVCDWLTIGDIKCHEIALFYCLCVLQRNWPWYQILFSFFLGFRIEFDFNIRTFWMKDFLWFWFSWWLYARLNV